MLKLMLLLYGSLLISGIGHAQGMQVGNVLVINHPLLKNDVDPGAFQTFATKEFLPALEKQHQGPTYHLFKADRGKQKGSFLLVSTTNMMNRPKAQNVESPFDLASVANGGKALGDLVTNAGDFTEYHLVGWDQIKSLPNTGILGIHFIQVKKERSAEFEKFVVEKLHPAVSQLFPDMQLLYYKAVSGKNTGSYITVFTIDSPAARDKYWPGGAEETEILKKTFKPLEGLAKELGTYLVAGSYLEPSSGGAAAYWESKNWTDFIHVNFIK